MNGLKKFLADRTPWSRRSIHWFWAAATCAGVMIILAYILLWLGIRGAVQAWLALVGQGASVLVTVIVFWGAYRSRRRDIEKGRHSPRS